MSVYDKIKENHAECKEQMSCSDWKRFAVKGETDECPVCGGSAFNPAIKKDEAN
jgi:NAD-dependent SIR2 family protein deacetylase